MRQLSIALVLLVLVSIGTYYLVVQQIHLQRYQDPQSIIVSRRGGFPKIHSPRPEPSFKSQALPKASPDHWSRMHEHLGGMRTRSALDRTMRQPAPWPYATLPVATPVQVTPLPAPTFVNHTLPPPVLTPPPFIPGYQPIIQGPDATASPGNATRRR